MSTIHTTSICCSNRISVKNRKECMVVRGFSSIVAAIAMGGVGEGIVDMEVT